MITKGEKFAFILIGVLIVATFIFWKDVKTLVAGKAAVTEERSKSKKEKKGDKKKGDNDKSANAKDDEGKVAVLQTWNMPSSLLEISGISYIGNNRFACVQDELGKIYIYNISSSKVEKEIPFGPMGDYEGIAVVGSTAYVLRADGRIFEVKNYESNPTVTQHVTSLTVKQDVEGITYDKKNNRLLLAIKGKEANNSDYKGIYGFDLATKKLGVTPVYKIDLNQTIFTNARGKNKLEPSDIDIHPITGDLYITEGATPKLFIMGADGSYKNIYNLSNEIFPQPEGIAFTPTGELFISNEGRKGTGTILKIAINQ
ncbi:MAG TPA: SdiA-regulated domain-containing protein [Chitinophagaceae bacterium]|jgi:uncharacterized protein YjiK|nr:SdiA-regulated domain-containing protein [Chitinophagaceae bacterium]